MAKKQAAPEEGISVPAEGTVWVRRGLYRGHNGRTFQSVPFGEVLMCMSGKVYDVREPFKYLWVDPQFQHLWDWQGDPEEVTPNKDGQVPPRP